MFDPRGEQEIEVFALDDDGLNPAPGSRPSMPGASDRATSGGADEIRQGPSDEQSKTQPPRIALGRGRSMAVSHVAAMVASLLVLAFVAGLLIGRGTGARRATDVGVGSSVDPVPIQVGSIVPTEPSFSVRFRVVVSDPLPSGTAGPKTTIAPSAVYALQLASKPINQPGQSLERRDRGATTGPWSLIVRRADGSLGHHSSVVTYPVVLSSSGPPSMKRIRIGASLGYVDTFGGIIWSIDGKHARIRGDLGRAALAAVAARVTVRAGRPVLTRPPSGLHVAASVPYRAPVVTESRYSNSLRLDSGPTDGLVFTDVLRCGSFEEALFVEGADPAANIGGHRAVTTSVGGGNATLAWEPTPGTVIYVGYSGGLTAAASTLTLVDLARGGRLLDRAQWRATHPSVVKDTNVYP